MYADVRAVLMHVQYNISLHETSAGLIIFTVRLFIFNLLELFHGIVMCKMCRMNVKFVMCANKLV